AEPVRCGDTLARGGENRLRTRRPAACSLPLSRSAWLRSVDAAQGASWRHGTHHWPPLATRACPDDLRCIFLTHRVEVAERHHPRWSAGVRAFGVYGPRASCFERDAEPARSVVAPTALVHPLIGSRRQMSGSDPPDNFDQTLRDGRGRPSWP